MKKTISIILSSAVAATTFAGTNAFAKDITVDFDGKTIDFDVTPKIIDGRTMVPLRKIFEEIGASVKWDNKTRTVSARKSSKTITLSIDSTDMQIDKGKTDSEGNPITETITLDVPAQIVSNRTLVPARAISESFGLIVDWDEENQKVIITSNDKEDESWKENIGSINLTDLTYDGKGIEIIDNQIKITSGGDYRLTGTLDNGNITISTKEKVKLRLDGVKITSVNTPCIFIEDADKAYITISEGSENTLIAEKTEDGAIYSKENLEIKGNGSLSIEALAGHGIKASDNLSIENGKLTINAASDGIHINDTFKMSGGEMNITATGDGIDCESIINISGGTINIETNGVPLETPQTTPETTQESPRKGMWFETPGVEFENSTKGISAEWMMVISGGDININSASHAIHCQDELEINGGKFTLSSKYDKGISAHGNLTINGADTIIDITKSVEGLESKNVMTINDGTIKIVSSDDAINATGGSSGMMMPGGNFGGNGEPGNRMPPEGFDINQMTPPTDGAQPNRKPQRGENGQFGGTRPTSGNTAMNENIPPFNFDANGEFIPPFNFDENREFVPPFENGEFTPPAGTWPQMGDGTKPEGFMGGMGRNTKTCLVINGGYIEACGNDDCIDANGTMIINGGIIKATNPTGSFTGNFGVLDADGQITIGEYANIILASSNGNAKSLGLKQNNITIYCENVHESTDKITVSDSSGNVVYEYTTNGSFKSVLIASTDIKIGEKYVITIGNETFETEITEQATVIGTQPSGGMGFGRGPGMR